MLDMQGFSDMSKYAGMREDLVQAGGGNSAFKFSPDRMAIKASGYQLADVTKDNGYAIVNPLVIRDAFLQCKDLDGFTEEDSKKVLEEAFVEGAKPSIETFLHSISGRYSLHTHPVVVNALTCRKNGKEIIKNIFGNALIVPYATPGVELAKAYFKEYKEHMKKIGSEPKYVFLLNHGFMASADTAEEVIELTENAVKSIEEYLKVDYTSYHDVNAINKLYESGITWLVTDKNVLDTLSEFKGLWNHCFCPDCVVFLGRAVYKADNLSQKEFDEYVMDNGYPTIIYYKSNMYIHAESVKKALEVQSVLSFSAQVMKLNMSEKCDLLSEKEQSFLLNWDAEKYRKDLK